MGNPLSLELILAEWRQGLRPDWDPRSQPYSAMLIGEFPEDLDPEVRTLFQTLNVHPRYPQFRDEIAELVVDCVAESNPAKRASYAERAKRRLKGLAVEMIGSEEA